MTFINAVKLQELPGIGQALDRGTGSGASCETASGIFRRLLPAFQRAAYQQAGEEQEGRDQVGWSMAGSGRQLFSPWTC